MEHLSEQEQLRRNSLQALRDLGINTFVLNLYGSHDFTLFKM